MALFSKRPNRLWISIVSATLALSWLGGWASYHRVTADAKALRVCKIARILAAEYRDYRAYVAKVPNDQILQRLMDQDLFIRRLREHEAYLRALKREVPDLVPPWIGHDPEDPPLDSRTIAEQMEAWELELELRFRCPKTLVPEEMMKRFITSSRPPRISISPWPKVFEPALARNREAALRYWDDVRGDTETLCRSRDALAKAQVINNYLKKRCDSNFDQRPLNLACTTPLRRSASQLKDLAEVVAVNETKFKEKWGPWLKSTQVQCESAERSSRSLSPSAVSSR